MAALVALVFVGLVLFGAVGLTPVPGLEFRIDVRHVFLALALPLAALVILRAPRERRVAAAGWAVVLALYPLVLVAQLVPLPRAVAAVVSPETVAVRDATWPGLAADCDGAPLAGARPPAWAPLSLDPAGTREHLLLCVAAAAAFVAAHAAWGASRRAKIALLVAVGVFAGLQALYGIVEWQTDAASILWMPKDGTSGPASGTLINRNHFALLLYLGLGAALTAHAARGDAGASGWRAGSGREEGLRALLVLAAALAVAGLVASASRAGAIGGAVVLLAALPLATRLRRRMRTIVLAGAALVAAPAIVVGLPRLLERLEAITVEWSSPGGRGAVLRASWEIVARYPWLGSGGGSFAYVFPIYKPAEIPRGMGVAHNDWLQALLETGALGLTAALVPVVLYAVLCWRRWRGRPGAWVVELPLAAALAMVALHAFVDFGLRLPAITLLVAVVAGAWAPALAMGRGAGAGVGKRGSSLGAASSALPAALAIAALAAAPVAGLHALARVPRFESALAWVGMAETRHALAERLAESRGGQAPRERRCEALRLEAGARRAHPLAPWYAIALAERSADLTADPSTAGIAAEALRKAAREARAQSVFLDAHDPFKSRRLAAAAWVAGDLDEGVAHAAEALVQRAAAGSGPRRIVADVEEAGVERGALIEPLQRAIEEGRADRWNLVSALLADGAWDLASALLPPERPLVADPAACENALVAERVLARAGDRGAGAALIEDCLARRDLALAPARRASLAAWRVRALAAEGQIDAARELVAEVSAGVERIRVELHIAQRERDWAAVGVLAQRLLDDPEGAPWTGTRVSLLYLVAESEARQGRLSAAMRACEEILRLDPLQARAEDLRRDLSLGLVPYR